MTMIEGQKVPDFNLIDQDDHQVTLESLKGKPAVLYFYPKDETPGCTVEACEFRDIYSEFSKMNCEIYGISPDDSKSHNKFISNHTLPFKLLCDPDKKMIKDFDVWGEKNMYGKISFGIVRSTFLIDSKGRIADWFSSTTSPSSEKIIKAIEVQLSKI